MRVKRGVPSRRRRRRMLKQAEGFRGRRKNCIRLARIAVERSMTEAFEGRKFKKRDFRKLWIQRINAAARLNGISYSRLISGLNKADMAINRKALADLAANDPAAFSAVVEKVRAL